MMLAAFLLTGLAPLDWLVGHCWRTELAPGTLDTHCFKRAGDGVVDRHQVTANGATVYWGETRYDWDAESRTLRFRYDNASGLVGRGTVSASGDRLDFGTVAYAGVRTSVVWTRTADGYQTLTAAEGQLPVRHVFVRAD